MKGVDWADWRSWLRRAAPTDWAAGPWPGTPQEREAQEQGARPLTVQAFAEDEPGERMAGQLSTVWLAFRRWWQDGLNTPPDAKEARARLEQYMPELLLTWHRLTAILGEDPGGRSRAGAVEPAAVPDRLLAGRRVARRPGAGAELRLGLPAFDATVASTADGGCGGAGHARLPAGAAGRRE